MRSLLLIVVLLSGCLGVDDVLSEHGVGWRYSYEISTSCGDDQEWRTHKDHVCTTDPEAWTTDLMNEWQEYGQKNCPIAGRVFTQVAWDHDGQCLPL